VKLTQATRLQSLSELIERLTTLESRLLDGGGLAAGANTSVVSKASAPTRAFTNAPPAAPKITQSLDDLDLPALPTLPKMPEISKPTVPAVATPSKASPAAQALSKPVSFDEPPPYLDEPPFDDAPPMDWNEPAFTPRAAARTSPAPARGRIAAGEEIEAIRRELETRKQHLLVTALDEAQLVYEPGVLRVTMASDDVWAKRLREAAHTFRDIGTNLFGQPLRIELVFNSQVGALINEQAASRAAAHEQAKQNAAVRLLLDKFKGEIVHVRAQAASGS
jgi:hypothetical protein